MAVLDDIDLLNDYADFEETLCNIKSVVNIAKEYSDFIERECLEYTEETGFFCYAEYLDTEIQINIEMNLLSSFWRTDIVFDEASAVTNVHPDEIAACIRFIQPKRQLWIDQKLSLEDLCPKSCNTEVYNTLKAFVKDKCSLNRLVVYGGQVDSKKLLNALVVELFKIEPFVNFALTDSKGLRYLIEEYNIPLILYCDKQICSEYEDEIYFRLKNSESKTLLIFDDFPQAIFTGPEHLAELALSMKILKINS